MRGVRGEVSTPSSEGGSKLAPGDVEENEMTQAGDLGWEDTEPVVIKVQGREVVQTED